MKHYALLSISLALAGPKTLATPAVAVAALAGRLQAALQAEGTSLAPLTEAAAQ
jgi:hypothetical protein